MTERISKCVECNGIGKTKFLFFKLVCRRCGGYGEVIRSKIQKEDKVLIDDPFYGRIIVTVIEPIGKIIHYLQASEDGAYPIGNSHYSGYKVKYKNKILEIDCENIIQNITINRNLHLSEYGEFS